MAEKRTDLAESRTDFSIYRSILAKQRTELAFIRTGLAFVALGIGMIRYFGFGPWTTLDIGIVVIGATLGIGQQSLHNHDKIPAYLRPQNESFSHL
ncbi:MAG: DUF202 domain-containing protein [Desulforhopalus sp.]|nr:DUF202 domain-containing protein [Desulforhopalus sp.]